MALANFSLPFGALAQPWGVTLAPLHPLHQLASNTNNLLYSPADHQQPQSPADAGPPAAGADYYKNNPYGPPEGQAAQQQPQPQPGYPYSGRRKQGSAYLPPTGGGGGATRNSVYHIQQQQAQQHGQHTQQTQLETNENSVSFHSSSASSSGQSQSTLQLTQSAGRGPAEGSYTRYPGQASQPPSSPSSSSSSSMATKQPKQYYNAHGSASSSFTKNTGSFSITSYGSRQAQGQQPQVLQQQHPQQPQLPNLQPQQPPLQPPSTQSQRGRQQGGGKTETPASTYGVAPPDNYPERAPGFTRVQAGQGSRTQVHAVLDYDVEEGDEEEEDDDGDYYDAQGQKKGECEAGEADELHWPKIRMSKLNESWRKYTERQIGVRYPVFFSRRKNETKCIFDNRETENSGGNSTPKEKQ